MDAMFTFLLICFLVSIIRERYKEWKNGWH